MNSSLLDILKKCDIYYDNSLISKEFLIKQYLSFFVDSISGKVHSVNFALHTGSICFDAVSVVAVGLGCLSYNISTSDDIIKSLQLDDIIMYQGERYRWKGIEQQNKIVYLVVEQDGKGKNGATKRWLPYERNKHLIKPYYGLSTKTDGRGVRRTQTNREDFLSYVFDTPISDVPAEIGLSVVVVTERSLFADICKKVQIRYNSDKCVGLLELFPASYYAGIDSVYQYGSNPTKSEPIFKVTSSVSVARDLVLDRQGNTVVGLLVSSGAFSDDYLSELSDLLKRKSLKFSLIASYVHSKLSYQLFELYEDAAVFACTKDYLSFQQCSIVSENTYTTELYNQVSVIINSNVIPLNISGGIDLEDYLTIRDRLFDIKQSELDETVKNEFLMTAQSLINLFNTSVFNMKQMEEAVISGTVNLSVRSPKARLDYIKEITKKSHYLNEKGSFVIEALEKQYTELYSYSPKGSWLNEYITSHADSKIAVIVPKAYYIDILNDMFSNVEFLTPSKFNPLGLYDAVIVCGEIKNKKFDPLKCFSSSKIYVRLYGCEEKAFSYRQRKNRKYEKMINSKIGISNADSGSDISDTFEQEEEFEIKRFSSLDDYIDSLNIFDLRKLSTGSYQSGSSSPMSEVTYVGRFETGEQIFFSKYYTAIVYDASKNSIEEKEPSKLIPGDVLVFTKKDDYTRNIVDIIYSRLIELNKIDVKTYRQSLLWKKCLLEYKTNNKLKCRDISRQLKTIGFSVQETTVRHWLSEDSHTVGPQKEEAVKCIARLTKNADLLKDSKVYFEACRDVRHQRREILKLIEQAINEKLSGLLPPPGSVLEAVYDNVDKLSETLTLEDISEFETSVSLSINLVNRPINETEV